MEERRVEAAVEGFVVVELVVRLFSVAAAAGWHSAVFR